MDRYSFALAAAKEFDLSTDGIIPVATSDLHQRAQRPLRAGLKINLATALGHSADLPSVKDGLAMARQEWASLPAEIV